MRYLVIKDSKKRVKFLKKERSYIMFKALLHDERISRQYRGLVRKMFLKRYKKGSHLFRVRNRCVITGRARGILRKFKLSRLEFRELANNGKLPGISRSSW